MTGNAAPPRRRPRRIGLLLPLLATPVIFFSGIFLAGLLDSAGAPEILWRVPWVLAIGGALASIVVFLVEVVRTLSPGGGRSLTPEEEAEYAEYVSHRGGVAPPPSPTGLLVFAIALTIVSLGVVALIVVNLPHALGLAGEPAVEWGPGSSSVWLIVAVVATPVTWGHYAAARRAQEQYRSRPVEMPEARPERAAAAGRRHRTWILPLLAMPAIVVLAVLVSAVLVSGDAPDSAFEVVASTMLVCLVAAAIVLVAAVLRFQSTPRAPRASGAPRGPGFYESLSSADAANRGLTPEEYGVYKGDVGSAVQPINSAGGLLFLAILLTVINAFLLVLVGVLIAQANGVIPRNPDDRELSPVEWGFFVLGFLSVPIAWRYYIVERRAQKLRVSRGLPKTLR